MKKFKFFALTALFCAMGLNANAAIDTYALNGGIRYGFDATAAAGDGEDGSEAHPFSVTVLGADKTKFDFTSKAVVIPAKFSKANEEEEMTYYEVVAFDAAWTNQADEATRKYQDIRTMTSLTINIDNFAAIPVNAYADLSALTSLTLIDNKVDADKKPDYTALAVADLNLTDAVKKSLTTLNIEKTGVTIAVGDEFKVAENVFDKLTTVTLPEGLTEIGASSFEGFKGTTISVPAGVTIINEGAFKGAALTGITFETDDKGKTSLTEIGVSAFEGCAALASIALPAEVTLIRRNAFKGCVKLATATIPGKLEAAGLGKGTFQGCKLLEKIDLSASEITTVWASTFEGCEKLKEVKLPSTLIEIKENAFAGTIIEELNAPKVATIGATIFGAATKDEPNTTLKTLVLGDVADLDGFAYFTALEKVTLGAANIKEGAFAYCSKLAEVNLGAADPAEEGTVEAKAFYYCTGLKTFNYAPATFNDTDLDTELEAPVDEDAFLGCSASPLVKFVTSTIYQKNFKAPKNTTYGTDAANKVKTVLDKGGSGKYYGKYEATGDVSINPADAKVYSVYVDKGIAYFQSLIQRNGKYELTAGDHVILKTDEEKEIEVALSDAGGGSVLIDDIETVNVETDFADYQENFMEAGEYLYRLTNNGTVGFGFSYFTGTKMKPGQFFIISENAPAAGRLEIVWLDENGNPEDETTAIQKVETKAEDGAIYNLAGQKVNASYKGVVIKNGKKYIK